MQQHEGSAESRWLQNQLMLSKLNEQSENTHSNKKLKSNLVNQSLQKKKIVKIQKKSNSKYNQKMKEASNYNTEQTNGNQQYSASNTNHSLTDLFLKEYNTSQSQEHTQYSEARVLVSGKGQKPNFIMSDSAFRNDGGISTNERTSLLINDINQTEDRPGKDPQSISKNTKNNRYTKHQTDLQGHLNDDARQ